MCSRLHLSIICDGWIRKMMKGAHSTQVLILQTGLFWKTTIDHWCFRLWLCHGVDYEHILYAPPASDFQPRFIRLLSKFNSVRSLLRMLFRLYPGEIPPVLMFDQSKLMTLLFCIQIGFGASSTHKSWLQRRFILRINTIGFWFVHKLPNAIRETVASQPTFWWVVLPYDVGVWATHRLAHQIDVAALIDRDILGYVSDPGRY